MIGKKYLVIEVGLTQPKKYIGKIGVVLKKEFYGYQINYLLYFSETKESYWFTNDKIIPLTKNSNILFGASND